MSKVDSKSKKRIKFMSEKSLTCLLDIEQFDLLAIHDRLVVLALVRCLKESIQSMPGYRYVVDRQTPIPIILGTDLEEKAKSILIKACSIFVNIKKYKNLLQSIKSTTFSNWIKSLNITHEESKKLIWKIELMERKIESNSLSLTDKNYYPKISAILDTYMTKWNAKKPIIPILKTSYPSTMPATGVILEFHIPNFKIIIQQGKPPEEYLIYGGYLPSYEEFEKNMHKEMTKQITAKPFLWVDPSNYKLYQHKKNMIMDITKEYMPKTSGYTVLQFQKTPNLYERHSIVVFKKTDTGYKKVGFANRDVREPARQWKLLLELKE